MFAGSARSNLASDSRIIASFAWLYLLKTLASRSRTIYVTRWSATPPALNRVVICVPEVVERDVGHL
jgi:hypothetical protein